MIEKVLQTITMSVREEKFGDAMVEQLETVQPAIKDHAGVLDHEYSREEERKLVRKLDLVILPLLSGTIFFAYLVCLRNSPSRV